MDQREKELIENCDAVIWASVECANGTTQTMMNFFRVPNRVKPKEMGYTYTVMTFKKEQSNTIDFFSAIIGDPKTYVENLGAVGINGMMFKEKSCTKKEMKGVFAQSLKNWGFSEKEIKTAIKMV